MRRTNAADARAATSKSHRSVCVNCVSRAPRCSSCGTAWRASLKVVEIPPLAERLVRWSSARSPHADSLIGDLEEEFARVAERASDDARRWYWKRALSLSWHYLPSRLRPRRATSRSGDSFMTTFLADLRFAGRMLR